MLKSRTTVMLMSDTTVMLKSGTTVMLEFGSPVVMLETKVEVLLSETDVGTNLAAAGVVLVLGNDVVSPVSDNLSVEMLVLGSGLVIIVLGADAVSRT